MAEAGVRGVPGAGTGLDPSAISGGHGSRLSRRSYPMRASPAFRRSGEPRRISPRSFTSRAAHMPTGERLRFPYGFRSRSGISR